MPEEMERQILRDPGGRAQEGRIFLRGHILLVILLATVFYVVEFLHFQKQLLPYPLDSNSGFYFSEVLSYAKILGGPDPLIHRLWTVREHATGSGYQPLWSMTALALARVLGRNWLMIVLVPNAFHLVVLLVSIYLLTREIADRAAGLFAILLVICYPPVFSFFRTYCLEFPLMGILTLALYLLIKSDRFLQTKESLWFSVVCSWGLLIKYSFGAFILGPVLVAICSAWLGERQGLRRRNLNLLFMALIAVAVLGPWLLNQQQLMHIFQAPFQEAEPWRWDNVVTTGLWDQQLSPPFFIVFCLSLWFFLRRTERMTQTMLYSAILVPDLIMAFMPHWKPLYYILPQLPLLAVISGAGLARMNKPKVATSLVFTALAIGIIQYFDLSYGLGLRLSQRFIPLTRFRYCAAEQIPNLDHNLLLARSRQWRPFLSELTADARKRCTGLSPCRIIMPFGTFLGPSSNILDEVAWLEGLHLSTNALPWCLRFPEVFGEEARYLFHCRNPQEPAIVDRLYFLNTAKSMVQLDQKMHGTQSGDPWAAYDWEMGGRQWVQFASQFRQVGTMADKPLSEECDWYIRKTQR